MLSVDKVSPRDAAKKPSGTDLCEMLAECSGPAVNATLTEVNKVDLKRQRDLVMIEHGIGFETAQEWEADYRRWLALNKLFPSVALVPPEPTDHFWHQHIIDTAKYFSDCESFFGYYFHHTPGVGQDEEKHSEAAAFFKRTVFLWEGLFGAKPLGGAQKYCKSGCRRPPTLEAASSVID